MEILAFDQSKSCTGWARWKSGDPMPVCGSFNSGGPYTTRGQMIGKFYREVSALLAFPVDLVVYETPLRGDAQSTEENNRNANALTAVIELVCIAKRVRCGEHDNNAWKASFFNTDIPRKVRNELGKSVKNPRYDPKKISEAMCRAFGFNAANHNEADACGLLDHALSCEGITAPWRMDHALTPVAEVLAA